MEGLRVLARIIARHYLGHPELYPAPTGDIDGGTGGAGKEAPAVNAPARAGGNRDLGGRESRKEAAE